MIEFALVFPMLALFIFGMIYGALLFWDYLNFSNDARTVARTVAVAPQDIRDKRVKDYNAEKSYDYSSFYTVKRTVYYVETAGKTVTLDVDGDGKYTYTIPPTAEGETATPVSQDDLKEVLVTVTFERDNKDLPPILQDLGFPPETIKPIEYKMKLE